jgi:hypothetical protein
VDDCSFDIIRAADPRVIIITVPALVSLDLRVGGLYAISIKEATNLVQASLSESCGYTVSHFNDNMLHGLSSVRILKLTRIVAMACASCVLSPVFVRAPFTMDSNKYGRSFFESNGSESIMIFCRLKYHYVSF